MTPDIQEYRRRLEEALRTEAARAEKPAWRDMLAFLAARHAACVHGPLEPMSEPWEEIGQGYFLGRYFGHWDVIHAVLDQMAAAPWHAAGQLRNNLRTQKADGRIPMVIHVVEGKSTWREGTTYPPVWPVAVDEYCRQTGDNELICQSYPVLVRLLGWFEVNRRVGEGFWWRDMVDGRWESGIDEGVRWDGRPLSPQPCLDATCQVYLLYDAAARWAEVAEKDVALNPHASAWGSARSTPALRRGLYQNRADALAAYVRERLFCDATGQFHDAWSVSDPKTRHLIFETIWPLVVGVASDSQAQRVIDEGLLNPERFFTPHPIATLAVSDPAFEMRMWRGPAWNSMTYWAARGCLRYGRADAAKRLLEKALDASAKVFHETGTVWEYYHPHGGDPETLKRKASMERNKPCRDYLGHDPFLLMARMWRELA